MPQNVLALLKLNDGDVIHSESPVSLSWFSEISISFRVLSLGRGRKRVDDKVALFSSLFEGSCITIVFG